MLHYLEVGVKDPCSNELHYYQRVKTTVASAVVG